MNKTEAHIVDFTTEIDAHLAQSLGEMVVAFGRLEDMFKVAIKRIQNSGAELAEVIKKYSGYPLGSMIKESRNFPILGECCDLASTLNVQRNNFIHATVAVAEDGSYIRFRKLAANTDLANDIVEIRQLTESVNQLILKIDAITGSLAKRARQTDGRIVAVSAATAP